MKKIMFLFAVAALLSGCVTRTMTKETPGKKYNGKTYGAESKPIAGQKKIIWIWQDEYRNSK